MPSRLVRTVVTAFAVSLMLGGIALTFLPEEVARFVLGAETGPTIVLSLLGGALFGLGLVNWMTRHTPLGGIYGRPLVLANLVHDTVGGMALVRWGIDHTVPLAFWIVTMLYLAGAAFYGLLVVHGPAKASNGN